MPTDPAFLAAVHACTGMANDPRVAQLCQVHGLHCTQVTWEDTGRHHGSAVGPNISDLTLQVQTEAARGGGFDLHCLPVIRHPNFTDLSCDVPIDRILIPVGNERGQSLTTVPLHRYLGDLRQFLTVPESWRGAGRSLLAPRDTHVLVSAQACFLPVPRQGAAVFNPVLFNYQSEPKHPAVLTILVTPEGTSATIIDNERDAFDAGDTWGQRIFFNQAGERASLRGERISDAPSSTPFATTPQLGQESGRNLVLLIQVPLIQRRRHRRVCEDMEMVCYSQAAGPSDLEDAVITHGPVEGPFTEIDHCAIRRDARFPIRVTVQFYLATASGQPSAADIDGIAARLRRVYADSAYVGSLVVGNLDRPTAPADPSPEPPDWWFHFWLRQARLHGGSPEQALYDLTRRLGRLPANPTEAGYLLGGMPTKAQSATVPS
jgi:hypothetical protein